MSFFSHKADEYQYYCVCSSGKGCKKCGQHTTIFETSAEKKLTREILNIAEALCYHVLNDKDSFETQQWAKSLQGIIKEYRGHGLYYNPLIPSDE